MTYRQQRRRNVMVYLAVGAAVLAVFAFFLLENLEGEAMHARRAMLNADWSAASGFFRIENQRPMWVYDRNDPDQLHAVEQIRQVLLIADEQGNVVQASKTYESVGLHSANIEHAMHDPDEAAHYFIERDANGTYYHVRSGWKRGADNRRYFMAIGRELPRFDGWLEMMKQSRRT